MRNFDSLELSRSKLSMSGSSSLVQKEAESLADLRSSIQSYGASAAKKTIQPIPRPNFIFPVPGTMSYPTKTAVRYRTKLNALRYSPGNLPSCFGEPQRKAGCSDRRRIRSEVLFSALHKVRSHDCSHGYGVRSYPGIRGREMSI